MVDIENKDILQICGTIIAGGLIFLTLVSFSGAAQDREKSAASVVFGMSIIIIFSIAARTAIIGNQKWALRIINFGLGFLPGIASVVVVVYVFF